MVVALASRTAVAAAGAVSLILCSAAQCSTAFVLQSPSLRSTQQQERSRTVVGLASSALPARGPRRRLPSPAAAPIAKRGARWGGYVRLAAEPEGATAEKDSDGEQQPILGEGGVVGAVEGAPEEDKEAEEEGVATEAAGEETGEKGDVVEEKVKEEEEEEEEEVDPMAEVKQQIKDLEKELQQAENKLADATDAISEKGQMGFLRMAAKVDNFRKKSGSGSGEYESDAKAAVLKAMLPAFKPFEAAEEELTLETENEIKFNGNYQALYRQLKDVYTKIGASDFFGVVGEKFDSRRHIKMSEEHNADMAAGNILQCLSPGLELKKNVIQKASCVVSLGPEKVEEEEVEPDAKEAVEGEGEGEGSGDGETTAPSGTLRDAGAAEGEGEANAEGGGGEEPAAA